MTLHWWDLQSNHEALVWVWGIIVGYIICYLYSQWRIMKRAKEPEHVGEAIDTLIYKKYLAFLLFCTLTGLGLSIIAQHLSVMILCAGGAAFMVYEMVTADGPGGES